MTTIFHLHHDGKTYAVSQRELCAGFNTPQGSELIDEWTSGRLTAETLTDARREEIASQCGNNNEGN